MVSSGRRGYAAVRGQKQGSPKAPSWCDLVVETPEPTAQFLLGPPVSPELDYHLFIFFSGGRVKVFY